MRERFRVQGHYQVSCILLCPFPMYHWQGCRVNAASYHFLLDSIESAFFCTSSFFSLRSTYINPVLRALSRVCARVYFLFLFFLLFSLNFLSVSNNWTGPHSALSHGHTYLPACIYLPLPAYLRFPSLLFPLSSPRCIAWCIHSPVSHRCTCILSYVARTSVRNGAHANFDTRTHARTRVHTTG